MWKSICERCDAEVTTPVQIAAILRDLHSGENRDAQISAFFESLNAGISSLQRNVAEIVHDVRQRNMNPLGLGTNLVLGTPVTAYDLSSLGNINAFARPVERAERVKPARDERQEAKAAEGAGGAEHDTAEPSTEEASSARGKAQKGREK